MRLVPRIGIITGVKSEEATLASIMGAEEAPLIRLSGARPARARAGIETGEPIQGDGGALSPEHVMLLRGNAGGEREGEGELHDLCDLMFFYDFL